jgi:hypothetical protein
MYPKTVIYTLEMSTGLLSMAHYTFKSHRLRHATDLSRRCGVTYSVDEKAP